MIPELERGAKLSLEFADAVAPAGARASRAMLSDVAGKFAEWVPDYPVAERLLGEPLQGLQKAFAAQRDALSGAIEPARSILPQLGLHGTSLEGGTAMLAAQSARPLDFATFPANSARLGTQLYLSEVGRAMETGVGFSEKWMLNFGKLPGPVLVMDITKARGIPHAGVDVHREAQLLNTPIHEDQLMAPFSLPTTRNFEGTIYRPSEGRFSQIVSGTVDYRDTQTARPLFNLIDRTYSEQLANGAPQAQLMADLNARGRYVEAVRRLDYAHQAISKWLSATSA
jgi:hypothetical protein